MVSVEVVAIGIEKVNRKEKYSQVFLFGKMSRLCY